MQDSQPHLQWYLQQCCELPKLHPGEKTGRWFVAKEDVLRRWIHSLWNHQFLPQESRCL